MIKSLFDHIEEVPQKENEAIARPEEQQVTIQPEEQGKTEELAENVENLPEETINPSLPETENLYEAETTESLSEISDLLELPDYYDQTTETETRSEPTAEMINEIEPPNEVDLPKEFQSSTDFQTAFDFQPINEIEPPVVIPILQDSKTNKEQISSPEINSTSDVRTIDELRMQLNTSNTRDLTTDPETTNELVQVRAKTESIVETARNSGLAYAAAISLFASVTFLLIIGWFADLLLGTSPWGIVGGIVLGSLIGFFQFFRMTSQIFKNKD